MPPSPLQRGHVLPLLEVIGSWGCRPKQWIHHTWSWFITMAFFGWWDSLAEGHEECDSERNILLLPLSVSLLPGSPEVSRRVYTACHWNRAESIGVSQAWTETQMWRWNLSFLLLNNFFQVFVIETNKQKTWPIHLPDSKSQSGRDGVCWVEDGISKCGECWQHAGAVSQ